MSKEYSPVLSPAKPEEVQTLLNLGMFYEYDQARICGWQTPNDGLFRAYHPDNYISYLNNPQNRYAYFVRVQDELAGFVLINKVGTASDIDWHVGEFFILGKFQRYGIGTKVAHAVWKKHPGQWEVTIIPENKPALFFWRKAASTFSPNFLETLVNVPWDSEHPERVSLKLTSPPF